VRGDSLTSDAIRTDATEGLVRLDGRLARSPVRDGFIQRQHFAGAAAALWLEGELAHLVDLVLHDAHMDVRTPTHELTRAYAVLRARRQILLRPRDWALSRDGFLALTRRRGSKPARGEERREGEGAFGPEVEAEEPDVDRRRRSSPRMPRIVNQSNCVGKRG
jgi:hypothetical protein